MSDDKPSLAEAIRLLAERDRRTLGAHPKIEELAAYHAGELAPDAEARVREHIALCRECSDLLLDLINFADLTPPPGEPDITDDELEEDWKALRARMGEKEPAPVVPFRPTAPASPAVMPRVGRARSRWLIAASLAAAVLGTAFGLYQKAQLAKALEIKPANDIYQGSATRGEGARYSAQQPTALHLEFEDEREYSGYEFEILRGRDVVSKFEVKPKEPFRVDVVIPAGSLGPGQYLARLYGIGEGRRQFLADLEFKLNDP